jgi:hypothetical protein
MTDMEHRESTAARIRDRVLTSSDRFWRPEDFKGSTLAVDKTLSRLEEAGELRRVRRGLYWRGSWTPLGMAPPPARAVAEVVNDDFGVGPAGLSASHELGLTTQVPRASTMAVPGRAPRSMPGLLFVSRESQARRDERLNPVEVALLEVLRDWDRLVDAPTTEAINRIALLIKSGEIRANVVARASRTEPARVRERLRTLLSRAGKGNEAARIRPARSKKVQDIAAHALAV